MLMAVKPTLMLPVICVTMCIHKAFATPTIRRTVPAGIRDGVVRFQSCGAHRQGISPTQQQSPRLHSQVMHYICVPNFFVLLAFFDPALDTLDCCMRPERHIFYFVRRGWFPFLPGCLLHNTGMQQSSRIQTRVMWIATNLRAMPSEALQVQLLWGINQHFDFCFSPKIVVLRVPVLPLTTSQGFPALLQYMVHS